LGKVNNELSVEGMGENMGIEMELLLISKSACRELLKMKWSDVLTGMEESSLRHLRPQADENLHRSFDVDGEAEILDWAQQHDLDGGNSALEAIQAAKSEGKMSLAYSCEGVLLLMRWASIGYWEAWEGRSFLYFDLLLQEPAEDIQMLYHEDTWAIIKSELARRSAKEYTQQVVMDWMRRRKELGETIDEKSDPHIIPTMQSHTRLSEGLHHAVTQWTTRDDIEGILGREHLSAEKWGHHEWGLSSIVNSGLP
jgi:hypothetical protein